MSLRPACAASGPCVHKKGNNVPLVVVGIFTGPHKQNSSEYMLEPSQSEYRIPPVFHVSIFCPLQNSKKQTNKSKQQQQQQQKQSKLRLI